MISYEETYLPLSQRQEVKDWMLSREYLTFRRKLVDNILYDAGLGPRPFIYQPSDLDTIKIKAAEGRYINRWMREKAHAKRRRERRVRQATAHARNHGLGIARAHQRGA